MVLRIPLEIWQQMLGYAIAVLPKEVIGVGTITQISNYELTVTKIFLPRQHTNAAYSEVDDGELNKIITDLIDADSDEVENLRFRWHSHGLGQTFWSQTDNDDIEKWQAPWAVNLVINARADALARLDLFEPFRIANLPLEVVIDYFSDPEVLVSYRKEVMEKVKDLPLPRNFAVDPRKRIVKGGEDYGLQ